MSDKTDHPPLPPAFAELGVRNSVLKSLAEAGYVEPSEIQRLLIPRAMAGVDLLGQARTGTGKTAAFGVPIVCRAEPGAGIQSLIMTPTRELAVQVNQEMQRYCTYTPIRCIAVYGGQKIAGDIKALKNRPEIVVGTPGRVIDLLDRRLLSLEDIRFIVLDEVDRMLDIGFRDDIRNILSRLKGMRQQQQRTAGSNGSSGSGVTDNVAAISGVESGGAFDDGRSAEGRSTETAPVSHHSHQTIFVSATFTDEIERLARRYMREPVEKLVAPGADDKPTVEKVEQYYLSVQPWDKYRLLRTLLKKEQPELAIIFMRTKHGAEKVAKNLSHDGIDCEEIHGNLRQTKRDSVMKAFKHGRFHVLVATDLASRGIDVAGITHIINYDIPEDTESYVHRIGRTARMGAEGKAYTFVTSEQGDELTRVENMINMIIPKLELEGFEHRPAPEGRGFSAPAVGATPAVVVPTVNPKNAMRLGAKMPTRRRRR